MINRECGVSYRTLSHALEEPSGKARRQQGCSIQLWLLGGGRRKYLIVKGRGGNESLKFLHGCRKTNLSMHDLGGPVDATVMLA